VNYEQKHDQTWEMIDRAVEDFILIYLFIWFVKRFIRSPVAGLMFFLFSGLAIWSVYLITHDDWIFYPLAALALVSLGRVIRI
jgi:hypothetical protein